MPCPHYDISIISRRQSAVAAAYQSGDSLLSEYDNKRKSYKEKRGIIYTEIMLPSHAPPEFMNRETLWNADEKPEKQWNSQLARRIVLALPRELDRQAQIEMLQRYCREQFVSRGMCVDFALHDRGDGNPHAHIMLTMRALDEQGHWLPKSRKVYDLQHDVAKADTKAPHGSGDKSVGKLTENGERIRLPSGEWKSHKENTVDWNEQANAELWRHSWETLTNEFLERAGRPERVDLRSFERQGIEDKMPTVHLGAAAYQMEKRGVPTFAGNLNRDIQRANGILAAIKKTISSLHDWLTSLAEKKQQLEIEKDKCATIPMILMKYLDIRKAEREDWTYGQQTALSKDFKKIADVITYVQERGITTLDELDSELYKRKSAASACREKMKGLESRIKDLSSIIKAHETIERLKPVHDKYVKINWKAVKAKYADEHKAELDEYNKAFRLLKKFNIDLSFHFDAYEGERKNLKPERDKLQEQLEKMKADLKPLEDVRYYVGKVIPLDDLPVQTVPEKQSVLESISAAKQEQAEKQAVQTELPSNKKRRNDLE